MTIGDIQTLLGAEVLSGEDLLGQPVLSACGSDMMSDVLAFVKEQSVLLTGLVNPQVIRTAEMMDMRCVVFVRGKKPDGAMLTLAKAHDIAVLQTPLRLYTACGRLYAAGLKGEDG
ncbi:MAG: hypothetical protein LBR72_00530 [Oscillospiraceae bacterium]|jgi:hypothetical protein|nr:hypothetical protein [Oscillospiraceae bacterium]